MNTTARKHALRFFYTKVVEPMGFKFTPDADLAEFLLDQEVALDATHGIPFCPCRPIRRERDMPNTLGVDYNAHVIESILKYVAPKLRWR